MKLSVVIITHNEEPVILRCLKSVIPVADEILIVDSFSTDRTPEICKEQGCKVLQRVFDGYGTQKQFAVDQAANNWVLSVDADEVVTPELAAEIIQTLKEQEIVPLESGYRIPFALNFLGRELRHGGVGREYHLRLFDREKGRFTRVPVHEGVEVDGHSGILKGRVIHYSYRNIRHHIEKINTYTDRAAESYLQKGKSFPKGWVALKFPVTFITFYCIKGGILDGYPGFIWSFLAAFYASLKIAKTIEAGRNNK